MTIAPNPFVYEKTIIADIKSTTIPALLEEQYAQCGEDIIIMAILKAIISSKILQDANNMIVVEVGGNHGYSGSNSYLISKELKIPSIIIEANPELIGDLIKARPEANIIHAAIVSGNEEVVEIYISNHHELSSLDRNFVEGWHHGQVGIRTSYSVPAMQLNHLLQKHIAHNQSILLLSIDIEGKDLEVAESINFEKWRPLFVQMEPSEHHSPGESVRMIDFMKSIKYGLIARTNVNLIFMDYKILILMG